MADTLLYLRDPVYAPTVHIALTLVALEHRPGEQACVVDMVDSPEGELFIDAAMAAGRLIQAGIYQAPDKAGHEVKVLLSGRVRDHWRHGDVKPPLRGVSLRLEGPMQDLATG